MLRPAVKDSMIEVCFELHFLTQYDFSKDLNGSKRLCDGVSTAFSYVSDLYYEYLLKLIK